MGLAGDSNVIISGVLRDRDVDADDRLLAARLAGDIVVMDDGIADLLLERLQDPAESEELRSHAAIALGPVLDL